MRGNSQRAPLPHCSRRRAPFCVADERQVLAASFVTGPNGDHAKSICERILTARSTCSKRRLKESLDYLTALSACVDFVFLAEIRTEKFLQEHYVLCVPRVGNYVRGENFDVFVFIPCMLVV